MTAFLVQVVIVTAVNPGFTAEFDSLIDQPFYIFSSIFNNIANQIRFAQTGAGNQGVLHMRIDGITTIEHGGYAALGVERRTLAQTAFRYQCHAANICQVQGKTQPGGTATDHQHIVFLLVTHVG